MGLLFYIGIIIALSNRQVYKKQAIYNVFTRINLFRHEMFDFLNVLIH